MKTKPPRLRARTAKAEPEESAVQPEPDEAAWVLNRVEKASFMEGYLVEQRTVDPLSVQTGADIDAKQICLPTMALSLEHLLGVGGLPLGLTYIISGPPGVGKTGFIAEMIRWAYIEGGGGEVVENEGKINGGWYASILGRDVWKKAMRVHTSEDVEDWQMKMTTAITAYQSYVIEKGLPKMPVFMVLDSLVGKTTAKEQEAILGEKLESGKRSISRTGHAKQDFARHAALNSKYLSSVTTLLDNWPMAIFLVNHQSEETDDRGIKHFTQKGGMKSQYLSSLGLRLVPLSSKPAISVKERYEYNDIRIEVFKNSLASKNRSCVVRLKWKFVFNKERQEYEQKTVWDWDWSLAKCLCDILTGTKPECGLYKSFLLEEGLHFSFPNMTPLGATGWSSNLFVDEAKTRPMTARDAVSWTKLGRMIRQDPEVRNKVRRALLIAKRPLLGEDGSYDEAAKKIRRQQRKTVTDALAKAEPKPAKLPRAKAVPTGGTFA